MSVRAWTIAGSEQLSKHKMSLSDCPLLSIWKGQLDLELKHLDTLWKQLHSVDTRLTEIAKQDERVQRLESLPGVGRRTAEVVVAYIDDLNRFKNARQVGAYAGLAPRQHQSGETNRMGKITRRGPRI